MNGGRRNERGWRAWRRRLRRRFKHRPGFVPWLLSRPALFLLALASRLPFARTAAAADRLARLAWFLPRRRALGRLHLERALPERSPAERDRILRRSLGSLGRSAAEAMVLSRRRDALDYLRERLDFEPGAEEILRRLARGPAVVVEGHLGAFEFLPPALHLLGLRVMLPMRRPNNHYLARDLERLRNAHGLAVVPRQGALLRLMRHLHSGGTVVLIADQNAHHQPLFADWFGVPAAAERAPAALALRTGAPLLVSWCLRRPGGRFLVGVREIRGAEAPGREGEEALREWTGRIHRALEDVIRRHPEQYLWIHDRYRTRPPEEVSGALPR